jgi:hypothetical protein
MNSTIFWYVMQYSQVEVRRCFGRTYCLHVQPARTLQKLQYFPPKHRHTSAKLHGVTSQNIELLKNTSIFEITATLQRIIYDENYHLLTHYPMSVFNHLKCYVVAILVT